MELQEKFDLAVAYIQGLPPSGPYNPSNDEKLQFYSLYKQSTEGPCKQKKPSLFDVVGKMKWDAWKKVSKLSKEEAQKRYVTVFTKVAKKINNAESKAVLKKMQGGGNNSVATAAAGGNEESVHVYGVMLSQPTRAVVWFCKINGIPFEFHNVDLLNGEQKSPEFTKINPLQKVPAIEYKGKSYFESHNILRVLVHEFSVPQNWYPSDFTDRCPIDTYLDWHHLNTRKACASLVFAGFFAPKRGVTISEEKLQPMKNEVEATLKTFEKVFLAAQPFIGGSNPSIADLLAYCEITQMDLINGMHRDASKFPVLSAWLNRMSALPHHDEVHKVLRPRSKL